MEIIIPKKSVWDPDSIKCTSYGICFKMSLDDLRQRFTYVQWFRGYGRYAKCVKDGAYKFNTKEKIVLSEPIIIEAFKILLEHRINNQFKEQFF